MKENEIGKACGMNGRRETYTGIWGMMKTRNHFEDTGVDGKVDNIDLDHAEWSNGVNWMYLPENIGYVTI
jgi:hypothetical protein